MAFNVAQFWAQVRSESAQLPEPFYFLMSLEEPALGSRGGVITEVPKHIAARLIVEKTARLATPDEVAAYTASQKIIAVKNAETERDRLLATNPLVAALASTARDYAARPGTPFKK